MPLIFVRQCKAVIRFGFQAAVHTLAVKLGGAINVQGHNLYSLAGEDYGEYTVLSVSHYFDGHGNYNNDFTAVPATIKVPPVKAALMPLCRNTKRHCHR